MALSRNHKSNHGRCSADDKSERSSDINLMVTEFETWLGRYRVGDSTTCTHFSYAGGKYFIPTDDNDAWLRKYAEILQRTSQLGENAVVFLIEKKTPVFRMHFDLDIIQATAMTKAVVADHVRLFCTVFKKYYKQEQEQDQPGENATTLADNTFVCYVLNAKSTPRRGYGENQPMGVKTGIHLIWPYLLVNQERALHLREACIYAAIEAFGKRSPPKNPYADMIDESVLLKNGLRMVGSDKKVACEECKEVPPASCRSCQNTKRVNENRVYSPYFVINEQ